MIDYEEEPRRRFPRGTIHGNLVPNTTPTHQNTKHEPNRIVQVVYLHLSLMENFVTKISRFICFGKERGKSDRLAGPVYASIFSPGQKFRYFKAKIQYIELNRSIVLPLSSTVTTMTLVLMSLMGTMLKVMMPRLVDKSSHRHH